MKKTKYIKSICLIIFVLLISLTVLACSTKIEEKPVLPPIPPIAPQIVELTDDSTKISWESMGTDVDYNVYKSATRNSKSTLVATTKKTFFTDTKEGKNVKTSEASYYHITAVIGGVETKPTLPASQETLLFGDYTYIFSPEDNVNEINRELAEIFYEQEYAQFKNGRYAVMFKPDAKAAADSTEKDKNYNDVSFNLGFYTEALGLGKLPTDTTVGGVRVDANWLGIPGPSGDSNATCNFWRSASNFTINPQVQEGKNQNTLWAVSQAAPMRRMNINGNLQLVTTGGIKNWGSGGYIADTRLNDTSGSQSATGIVDLGGQQQFYFRNMEATSFKGGQWNMVYQGINPSTTISSPKDSGKTTIIPTTPVIQEKPFIFIDDNGDYKVFVPGLRKDTQGISWGDDKPNNGMGVGTIKDISDFYIAKYLQDDEITLNKALSEGKSIIFTPGIYRIDAPLIISNPDTIVMGIGLATIYNRQNTSSMIISSKGSLNGINISGLIFDAGTKGSPALLKVGADRLDFASADKPIILSDMFFRVGGDIIGMADTCVEINVDNTIGDDFWVWRADHGAEVTWLKNTAENGLIVNGNDVTIYALMCEHFQGYETIWNGENGRLYFYQSEMPYDVINQEAWMSPNGANGYASYKVGDHVKVHEAWGLGIYSCFTRTGEPPVPPLSGYADGLTYVFADSAIEVPNAQGVKIHNACTVYLASDMSLRNKPSIKNVINNYGGAIYAPINRGFITEYCDPIDELPIALTSANTPLTTGKYTAPQQVTLSSPIEGSILWYTLDGSAPMPNNPTAIKYGGGLITVGQLNVPITLSIVMFKGNSISFEKKITVVVSDDLAVFQPTKASSSNNAAGSGGAVNGVTVKGTPGSSDNLDRWQAASAANEWWAVDLEDNFDIASLKISWDSANSCGYNYKIYYSTNANAWDNPADLSNWTLGLTVNANKTQINDLTPSSSMQARYIMMVGERTAFGAPNSEPNNAYKFAMWGFQAYGNKI